MYYMSPSIQRILENFLGLKEKEKLIFIKW